MSTVVKRYRLVSPESYDRLSMNSGNDVNTIEKAKKSKSRSPSPNYSDWRDIMLMMPKHYRRNGQMIMKYLAHLSDNVFRIMPGTMEIVIDNRLIPGSNFLELMYALHNNLLKPSHYPIGLNKFLYLLGLATAVPLFIVQNAKLRNVLKSIRLTK